jgi:8-oxo-dGTP pyrophosphatase MutT (NUDIX family)
VTLWIDPPRWPAHGRLWSHLISDTSLAELHEFAGRIGIPRQGFEGDHYDIPAERYDDVVTAGARETSGRDLLARLAASGLRLPKRKGDKGIERATGVRFPDGTTADVDLVASPREMSHERIFASMVLVTDAVGAHLLTWSERRREWSSCGGWREGDETPRETAVRETAEESGLDLDPAALLPRGYERFRRRPGGGPGLWVPGRDVLQVYSTTVPEVAPALRAESAGDPLPEWVDDAELTRRCGAAFWWPLAAYVLGVG